MTDSNDKPSRWQSFAALKRFFKASWWRHALAFALAFVRYFKTPVILSTIGSLFLVASFQIISSLKPGPDGSINGNEAIPTLFGYASCSIVAGIFMLIAIFMVVMRLAGFSRAFLKFPLQLIGSADYKKQIDTQLAEGLATVKAHKVDLFKAWLVSTVIMIPMLFVWCSSSFVVAGLTPQMVDAMQLPPGPINALRQGAVIALMVVGLILSNYSMAVLGMSTMINKTVKEVSIDGLWLSIIASPALTIVSLVVSAASCAITTPYAVPLLFQPAGQNAPIVLNYMSYAWQIWQGLTSLIVIPISVAMLLEVLRDSVVPLET